MNVSRYLPSAQFTLLVVSICISGALVFAADVITHPSAAPANVTVGSNDASTNEANWEATLYSIEAENASTSLAAPDPNAVGEMLQAAQSTNLTDTVGKSVFINLSNAEAQGMGDDIPTQDQIIAAAQAELESEGTSTQYTFADLNIVPDSQASLHAYGNALMEVFALNPAANEPNTFLALSQAVDNDTATPLQQLIPIQAGYAALTADLVAMPVPQTLAPLDLTIINDFVQVTASFNDMQTMIDDPLRGIAGLQNYQTSLSGISLVFTNIAQDFSKDGILFSKDEPGNAWAGFLAAPVSTPASSP
jgi:hypothetical protein